MQSKFELDAVAKALSAEWGEDSVKTDVSKNQAYLQFDEDIVTTLIIDCNLGVVHGLAELPNAFAPSVAPKTFEDQCIYANRLNIMLARELGVSHSFQVLNDTLTLTDMRVFEDAAQVVEVCDTLARDTIVLGKSLTQSLSQMEDDPAADGQDAPQNALFV